MLVLSVGLLDLDFVGLGLDHIIIGSDLNPTAYTAQRRPYSIPQFTY